MPHTASPFQQILAHDSVVERFQRGLQRQRLASTFLFVGPDGSGKRQFATALAQCLLCTETDEQQLTACGQCPSCAQVVAATHPDLHLVNRPPDKSFIPIERFIGDREHRMREGLCHEISLKPFMGRRKVAIVDDADYLNQEGANSLLKTLEEPPPQSLLILLATSEQRQLPTIRSRCQVVRFQPLSQDQISQILVEKDLVADREQAVQVATLAQGSMARAMQLIDEEILQFRNEFLADLAAGKLLPHELAKIVATFVDAAGKEAPSRRARMKLLMDFASQYYIDLSRRLCGVTNRGNSTTSSAEQWSSGIESATRCADRCVLAIEQVDANANQSTLLECWLDDLYRERWPASA